MECDSFIDIEFTGDKEKKMIDRLVRYKQFLKKMYPLSDKYYINPYRDERCSTRCYLNWVKYNQEPPRHHSCKCDSFKHI